jgi:hypothetical protein
MDKIEPALILKTAKTFADNGADWHFHILTPDCILNEKKEFAVIIEDNTNNTAAVCYFKEKPMSLGKEMLELLMGKDFIKKESDVAAPSSAKLTALLERISSLNNKKQFWHHHMLFPNCIFNKEKGKWNIILEDKGELLSYTSTHKPKAELAMVEKLFYSQE